MKRIDAQWWRDDHGYWFEKAKGQYQGPYATPQIDPDTDDSTVVDSGTITVRPIDKTQ